MEDGEDFFASEFGTTSTKSKRSKTCEEEDIHSEASWTDYELDVAEAAASRPSSSGSVPQHLPTFDEARKAYVFQNGTVAGTYSGWGPDGVHVNQRVTCKAKGHKR